MSYQGKSVKKPHVEVLDALSMSKFQKLLSDIKKAESDLTKESDIINQNLGILQTSVQRSAQLLLVKKGLYRQLRAFQLTCLPKTWNEFWLKKLPRVPTTDEPNQNDLMHKVLDKQIDHIDGERKFVGDLDLKVFHAIDNKKQLDNHQGKIVIDWKNLPDVAFSSDSDKSSIWNENEENWSYIASDEENVQETAPITADNSLPYEIVPPKDCHHCQLRGHYRIKSSNHDRMKNELMELHRSYAEIQQEHLQKNKVNWKNQSHKKKYQAFQDESYLNAKLFRKHQQKIAVLT
jgi:hypothetical protein